MDVVKILHSCFLKSQMVRACMVLCVALICVSIYLGVELYVTRGLLRHAAKLNGQLDSGNRDLLGSLRTCESRHARHSEIGKDADVLDVKPALNSTASAVANKKVSADRVSKKKLKVERFQSWNISVAQGRRLQMVQQSCFRNKPGATCDSLRAFEYCGMWRIVAGDGCKIDYGGGADDSGEYVDCVTSKNYPLNYDVSDTCDIAVWPDRQVPFKIVHLDLGRDAELTVPGPEQMETYTQSTNLADITTLTSVWARIEWRAGPRRNTKKGFRLCAVPSPNGNVMEKVLDNGMDVYSPVQDSCVISPSNTCASTANYNGWQGWWPKPDNYFNVPACGFRVWGKQTLSWDSQRFWSDKRKDYLKYIEDTTTNTEAAGVPAHITGDKTGLRSTEILGGWIYWTAGVNQPARAARRRRQNRGWKFCIANENKGWRYQFDCPLTCGACSKTRSQALKDTCQDDPEFEASCRAATLHAPSFWNNLGSIGCCEHFSGLSLGKDEPPSTTSHAFTTRKLCTLPVVQEQAKSWTGVISTAVTNFFVERMWKHCPKSCKLCEDTCGPGKVWTTNQADMPTTHQSPHVYSACVTCNAGKSSNSTSRSSLCQQCGPGNFAPLPGSACSPCEKGKYSNLSENILCLDCSAGRYSERNGSSICQQCGAGRFLSPLPGSACSPCEKGKYSNLAEATLCLDCSVGRFSNRTRSSICQPCGVGSFAHLPGRVACSQCVEGKYSNLPENSVCLDCSSGRYSNQTGSSICQPCGAGSFAQLPGSVACSPCVQGKYSNLAENSQCLNCEQGKFSNASGSTICTLCPEGETASARVKCVQCPPGKYEKNRSCEDCAVGSISKTGSIGKGACIDCDAGKYPDITTETCRKCDPGWFLNFNNGRANFCKQCSSGTVAPGKGSIECARCERGRHYSGLGGISCKNCSAGSYAASEAQADCDDCLPGKFQPQISSTACINCMAGEFQDNLRAVDCKPCAAGSKQSNPGGRSCLACPRGTYQPLNKSTRCDECDAGKFTPARSALTCVNCASGKVQPNRQGFQCHGCLPGEYQNQEGKTACISCAKGKYTSMTGRKRCTSCGKGRYSGQVRATDCMRCSKGSYSDTAGMTVCSPCPGLLTSDPGAMRITECVCPPSTYGLKGADEDKCKECPPGFYCPGGHIYGDNATDTSPRLKEGVMSLPSNPLRAFTCLGTRTICSGLRQPMFDNAEKFSQVCAGGRVGQACAGCPDWHYRTSDGCGHCEGLDKVLFWLAMPCFYAGMVLLHIWWNRPSVKERADQKAAVVCLNLYFLYIQILGVFQAVQIDWKPPFADILELTSYMRMRVDFLKPSCGISFSPFREYVTRGVIPLFGICSLYSVYLVCRAVIRFQPSLALKLAPQLRTWMYFINTTGAIYILFSCGITLTAFLPHQCIDNPGGFLTSLEWPVVLCDVADSQYSWMTMFSVFLVALYVVFFPSACLWQVIRYPVAAKYDPYFFIKYKFLFGNYNAEARYFGLVIMLRNVCISLISVFLQRDTFFQVTCMIAVMMIYLCLVCTAWPWQQPAINRLDIMGCMGLCGIMAVGSGFVEQDVNEDSLMLLLSLIFIVLIVGFLFMLSYFVVSVVGDRRDYAIFLSHAKGTGGATARLFKMMLASKLTHSTKIFLDSDNLVSLYELHMFVQHTSNLVLLLTPNCYAREWVAVELVTSYVHNINVILISVNGGQPPDSAFIENIPNVFRSCLEGRFPQFGINVEILVNSYSWIAEHPLLRFDVYADLDAQEAMIDKLLEHLSVGATNRIIATLLRRLQKKGISDKVKAMAARVNQTGLIWQNVVSSTLSLDDNTRVFLCKEKGADVQQEASVVCLKLVLKEFLAGDVYLPPVEAEFAVNLQIIEKLGKGCVLVLCLTKKVLCELDCVCEVVAAVQNGLFIVPVQVDPDFPFPGDAWYEQMRNGSLLSFDSRHGKTGKEALYEAIMRLIRTIFEDIAVPFNANGSTETIRSAGRSIMERYEMCQQQNSHHDGVAGQMSMRLTAPELEELYNLVKNQSRSKPTESGAESAKSVAFSLIIGTQEILPVRKAETDVEMVDSNASEISTDKPFRISFSEPAPVPIGRGALGGDSETNGVSNPKREKSKHRKSKKNKVKDVTPAMSKEKTGRSRPTVIGHESSNRHHTQTGHSKGNRESPHDHEGRGTHMESGTQEKRERPREHAQGMLKDTIPSTTSRAHRKEQENSALDTLGRSSSPTSTAAGPSSTSQFTSSPAATGVRKSRRLKLSPTAPALAANHRAPGVPQSKTVPFTSTPQHSVSAPHSKNSRKSPTRKTKQNASPSPQAQMMDMSQSHSRKGDDRPRGMHHSPRRLTSVPRESRVSPRTTQHVKTKLRIRVTAPPSPRNIGASTAHTETGTSDWMNSPREDDKDEHNGQLEGPRPRTAQQLKTKLKNRATAPPTPRSVDRSTAHTGTGTSNRMKSPRRDDKDEHNGQLEGSLPSREPGTKASHATPQRRSFGVTSIQQYNAVPSNLEDKASRSRSLSYSRTGSPRKAAPSNLRHFPKIIAALQISGPKNSDPSYSAQSGTNASRETGAQVFAASPDRSPVFDAIPSNELRAIGAAYASEGSNAVLPNLVSQHTDSKGNTSTRPMYSPRTATRPKMSAKKQVEHTPLLGEANRDGVAWAAKVVVFKDGKKGTRPKGPTPKMSTKKLVLQESAIHDDNVVARPRPDMNRTL